MMVTGSAGSPGLLTNLSFQCAYDLVMQGHRPLIVCSRSVKETRALPSLVVVHEAGKQPSPNPMQGNVEGGFKQSILKRIQLFYIEEHGDIKMLMASLHLFKPMPTAFIFDNLPDIALRMGSGRLRANSKEGEDQLASISGYIKDALEHIGKIIDYNLEQDRLASGREDEFECPGDKNAGNDDYDDDDDDDDNYEDNGDGGGGGEESRMDVDSRSAPRLPAATKTYPPLIVTMCMGEGSERLTQTLSRHFCATHDVSLSSTGAPSLLPAPNALPLQQQQQQQQFNNPLPVYPASLQQQQQQQAYFSHPVAATITSKDCRGGHPHELGRFHMVSERVEGAATARPLLVLSKR
jgi:hypothetical protein